MGSFLLQGTGGEGRCRDTFLGFGSYILNGKVNGTAFLQEGFSLLLSRETLVQLSFNLTALSIRKDSCYAEIIIALEILNLSFPLHNQTYCHALNTTGTQGRLYLTPQDRAELETYDTVQYPTGLLGIYQVQVYIARQS